MSSQRKERADIRSKQENPINVTIIEAGTRKVLTWEEYQKYLDDQKLPLEEVV